jgi:hypothetical protein
LCRNDLRGLWNLTSDPACTLGAPKLATRMEDLGDLGELVGVKILDRIVIGKGRFVSFVDDGYW